MRLITRGLILVAVFALIFSIFIVLYEYREKKETRLFISELEKKDLEILERYLVQLSLPVSKYLQDISLWNETVDFIKNRKSDFLADKIDLSGELYNIGEIWIYDPGFKNIYHFKNRNFSNSVENMESIIPSLKNKFESERFFTFYFLDNHIAYFMTAISIHSGSDRVKKTKPAGFIITAVPCDNNFISQVKSGSSHIKAAWINLQKRDSYLIDDAITLNAPLVDINGITAAYLTVLVDMHFIREIKNADRAFEYYLYIYIIFFIILTTAFFRSVVYPVKELYRALYTADYTPSSVYNKYTSFEFRRIMEMITLNKNVEAKLGEVIKETEIQKAIAEQTTKTKSEFLANMSHEIRTPMTGVMGFADMLIETSLDSEQRCLADGLVKSSRSVLNIINDILDLSKIESGKFELTGRPFSINAMIEDVILVLKGFAMDKGLNIVLDNRIEKDVIAEGDEKRLKQILLNIGGNAVKYTIKGEITFTATSKTIAGDVTEFAFEVKDSGVGMTEEQLGRIFEKYEQVHDPAAFTGGTGLGLAITKSLIELMNGSLEVKSTPGSGSVFTVRMSLKCRMGEILKPVLRTVKEIGLNILIADDNQINVRVLENILKKAGCSFKVSYTGEQAVEMAAAEKYDLILMDFQMPVYNGMEATEMIRSGDGHCKNTPIYAISADIFEESRKKSVKCGMNGFIMKPFVMEEIFTVLLSVKKGIDN